MPSLDNIFDLNRGISPLEQESIDALSKPSLSSQLLNSVFTPLKTFGLILDTPGSIIRGAIQGNLRRTAKGIFDPSFRISGNELLGGAKDKFSWSGLGAELALDPLNYISGGLTEAGEQSARLTGLLTKQKALRGFLGPADNFVTKHIGEVDKGISDLLGRGAKPLAETMAEQARTGQRAISIGLPFTKGIPIASGESLYKGLDTVGEFFKGVKATKPVTYLGKKFSATYGFDPVLKEQVNFARSLERKGEAEAFSAFHKLMNKENGDLVLAAKQLGTDVSDVNKQVLNYIETAYGKIDITGKTSFTPDNVLNAVQNTPKIIKDIGDALKRQVDELRVTGNDRGLFISEFGGATGYYPRYVTKEGEKFLKEIAKKHNITLKETAFDDALGVLSRIPGFEQLRKAFRNKTTAEANAIMQTKFGMKGDFFDTDIATSLSRRMISQGREETKRRFANAAVKVFATGDKKDAVKLSKLFANTKAGPAYSSKLYFDHNVPITEDILAPYRSGEYRNTAGNVVAWQTPESRKRAAELMKKTIYKYRNKSWAEYFRDVSENWSREDKIKVLDETYILGHIRDFIDSLIDNDTKLALRNNAFEKLTNDQIDKVIDVVSELNERDIKNAISNVTGIPIDRDIKTVHDYLNAVNNLYHGTASHNLPSIETHGLLGGLQNPEWRSTQLAGIDHPHTAWSPEYRISMGYAGDAVGRAPKGTEWYRESKDEFIKNKLESLYSKPNLAFPNIEKRIHFSDLYYLDSNFSVKGFIANLENRKGRKLQPEEIEFLKEYAEKYTPSKVVLKTKLSKALSTIVPEVTEHAKGSINPSYFKGKSIEAAKKIKEDFGIKYDLAADDIISSISDYLKEFTSILESKTNPIVKQKKLDSRIKGFAQYLDALSDAKVSPEMVIESINKHFDNLLDIAKEMGAKIQISKNRTVSNTNYEKILEELKYGIPFGKFDAPRVLGKIPHGYNDVTTETQFFNAAQIPKELFKAKFKSNKENITNFILSQLRRDGLDLSQSDVIRMLSDLTPEPDIPLKDVIKTHLDPDKISASNIGLLAAYKNALKVGDEYFEHTLAGTGKYINLGKEKIGERIIGEKPYIANIIRRSRGNKGTLVKQLDKEFAKVGLQKKYIPTKVYKDMSNILTDIKNPEWMKNFISIVDKSNAIFRGLFTSIVPSYHIRNEFNGKFMNLMAGITKPTEYIDSYKAFKNLSIQEVEELKSLGVIGRGSHDETIRIMELGKLTPNNAFTKLMKPGHQLAGMIDDFNRYTLYRHEINKGLTAAEAADTVKKYHFDYGDLSKFEKSVMRRSVLFYTFMRKNSQLMFESLFTNPKFMQAYARAVGKTNVNLIEPVWMTDAIFLGQNKNGEDRRLSLGLAPADLDKFDPMYKGIERFAQLLFSQLNPLLTQPAEFITGKDLYFDRPTEGNLPVRLLSASPLARLTGIAQRSLQNPEQEAMRSLLGLNIRTTPSNQETLNKQYILKTKLDAIAKSGQGRKMETVVPTKDADEEQRDNIRKLNSYIRKLQ